MKGTIKGMRTAPYGYVTIDYDTENAAFDMNGKLSSVTVTLQESAQYKLGDTIEVTVTKT
jgi:hypothetical protein